MGNSTPPLSGAPRSNTLGVQSGEELGGEIKQDRQSGGPLPDPSGQLFSGEGARQETRQPEISTSGVGRGALPRTGDIKLFGATIPRLGAPIVQPAFLDRTLADQLGGLFSNRGLLGQGDSIRDYRDPASVHAAMNTPLTAPAGAYGPITLFTPGLGNTAPGPAQIARHARHTEKLIITYANPGVGEEAKLRQIDELVWYAGGKRYSAPLPEDVRGKIFAIGSPKSLMTSYEQASDVLLEQLGVIQKSPIMRGVDLKNAKMTAIGHSQGGLSLLLARDRLEKAGLDGVIGTLCGFVTPWHGSPVSNENILGLFSEGGERLLDSQAFGAVNALDPDYVAGVVRPEHARLVDVAIAAHTDAGEAGRSDLRRFFKLSDRAIDVMSLFRDRQNDGLVSKGSQLFGNNTLVLEKSYDHAGVAEDWRVADVIAQQVAKLRGLA